MCPNNQEGTNIKLCIIDEYRKEITEFCPGVSLNTFNKNGKDVIWMVYGYPLFIGKRVRTGHLVQPVRVVKGGKVTERSFPNDGHVWERNLWVHKIGCEVKLFARVTG